MRTLRHLSLALFFLDSLAQKGSLCSIALCALCVLCALCAVCSLCALFALCALCALCVLCALYALYALCALCVPCVLYEHGTSKCAFVKGDWLCAAGLFPLRMGFVRHGFHGVCCCTAVCIVTSFSLGVFSLGVSYFSYHCCYPREFMLCTNMRLYCYNVADVVFCMFFFLPINPL